MDERSLVCVVDDDAAVLQGLDSLLRSIGHDVACFGTVKDFLRFRRPDAAACLLLDIRMPDMGGLELQNLLKERDDTIPVVFLTGHGDVPLSVRAMKAGALDFLLKPVNEQTLTEVLARGIALDRQRRLSAGLAAGFEALFRTLTTREAEIIRLVVRDQANKEIATRLGLKEITIKVNRANAMRKLQCRSTVDLLIKAKGVLY